MRNGMWHLPASLAVAALSMSAAHAQTVNVGSLYQQSNQIETLTGPGASGTVDLFTNVYFNSATSLYTYQYDLLNNGDPHGITTVAPTVIYASDYAAGLPFFFGGAVSGTGQVTGDDAGGVLGDTLTNTSLLTPLVNTASSLVAYNSSGQIQFSTVGTPIAQGQSNVSQPSLGDYYYIQSASGPGLADINVTDDFSADFDGPTPNAAAVPEPGSLSLLGIGVLALLVPALRARKARAA